MIDIAYIRAKTSEVKRMLERRGVEVDVERLLGFDEARRRLIQEVEQLRGKRKGGDEEKREQLRVVKEELELKEEELRTVTADFEALLANVPNLLNEAVPDGKTEEDNTVVKGGETPESLPFDPKDHLELGEALDIIDVKRATNVTGSRFYYLKGQGALLRLALINFAFEKLVKAGFTPFFTPHLAKERTLYGTGYIPFGIGDVYKVEDEDLHLIGTSEQTLVAYHADEIISADQLPLRYCGYSACFRTEAGGYGKDTKGIIRVHEFAKVEIIVFCKPNESPQWMEKIQAIEEEIVENLELPYRVTEACAGDISKAASRRWDVEVWFPAQRKFREVTSNSNLLDFQTRRLNIRAKDKSGEKFYPHTISATAVTDRHLIAMLENGQQKDGTVTIPKTLRPYCGFSQIG